MLIIARSLVWVSPFIPMWSRAGGWWEGCTLWPESCNWFPNCSRIRNNSEPQRWHSNLCFRPWRSSGSSSSRPWTTGWRMRRRGSSALPWRMWSTWWPQQVRAVVRLCNTAEAEYSEQSGHRSDSSRSSHPALDQNRTNWTLPIAKLNTEHSRNSVILDPPAAIPSLSSRISCNLLTIRIKVHAKVLKYWNICRRFLIIKQSLPRLEYLGWEMHLRSNN